MQKLLHLWKIKIRNSDLYFGDFEHCNLNSLSKYPISNKNHEILNVKNSLNSHKLKTTSSSLKFRILFETGISKQNYGWL